MTDPAPKPQMIEVPDEIVVKITYSPKTGEVHVDAPLILKPFCLHAIAGAIDAIADWRPTAPKPNPAKTEIITPSGGLIH